MRSWLAGMLLLASVLPGVSTSARVPIRDELPAALKKPVAELLQRIRPKDADAGLAGARTVARALENSGHLILRIEADCFGDLCMTVFGRIDDGVAVADVIVLAGPDLIGSDYGQPIWGTTTFSMFLRSFDRTILSISQIYGRWMVASAQDTVGLHLPLVPSLSKAPEPDASRASPQTFEEFRAQLGLQP